ncbi:MAG: tetratricopeptide repeat protein [Bacteroidaceae bacterium]|nr:tetratricopeptide repeat protein [Bacteroidaceae bacterium]
MKRFMTIMALMCVGAFQANAQESVEKSLKVVEEKVKLADKHPKDGKMQIRAAEALLLDELGEKRDYDRALTYANRALKIAMEQTVPTDTLKGLACYTIGQIFLGKGSNENAVDYFEMAMDAFEEELGKEDALTNGTKFIYSYMMMMNGQPFRAFPKVQEAFYYNSIAPQDKRIENMSEANIAMEMALEMLIASYTKLYRYALPMLEFEGKRYLVVQSKDWSMEQPLVGWLVPSTLRTEAEEKAFQGNETIFCDDNLQFSVIPEEDKEKHTLTVNFKHFLRDPRKLVGNEGNSCLWFLDEQTYNQVLTKFREFKASRQSITK